MRTVLHVLPHPGGGGERYVDLLARMEGYRFERVYLSPSPAKAHALRLVPRALVKLFRSADLVHAHGEAAAGISLLALATRRSVVTVHGLNILRRTTGASNRIAATNLRLVVRAAGRTICVGEAELAEASAAVGEALGARLTMIHNGIDLPLVPPAPERAAARARLGIDSSRLVGLVVGELSPVKDPLTAVKAAVQAERQGLPLVVIFAGEGPLRPSLEAAAAGSTAVHLLGHRDDVDELRSAADFFVLPSLREGLSFALLEAMGAGLPTVVSEVPVNLDAIGDAGVAVPVGDVRGFARAFQQMVDAGARADLGSAARERVSERFSADRMAEATRVVYDAVAP
jgi:glycosyltransferase involved in cell wall biosynthesis